MSISNQLYITQIVMLVTSNLSMLPSIIFCYQIGFYYLSVLLSSSAIASGFYHLCDMDVYCIAGFSFHSLQVKVCIAVFLINLSRMYIIYIDYIYIYVGLTLYTKTSFSI